MSNAKYVIGFLSVSVPFMHFYRVHKFIADTHAVIVFADTVKFGFERLRVNVNRRGINGTARFAYNFAVDFAEIEVVFALRSAGKL
ncbi:MAG: hypothetical protein L6V93_04665 [Clostridiales bacterium]|nr:MAG: hypothetical protein L6V93_04665 [Clostridiales bacterium]